jgi:hypothetical protein
VLYLLGFCEQRMERWDEATEHLVEARRITRDKNLREEIDRALSQDLDDAPSPAGAREVSPPDP